MDSLVLKSRALPAHPVETGLGFGWWKAGVLGLLIAWLYSSILFRLAEQWWQDPNFSHGFFVPAFTLFVLWRQRARLASLESRPCLWGLFIIAIALSVLVVGVLGAELFLSRVSLLLLLAGLILFFRGRSYFKAVLFPWAFLFLMIPIPAIVFNQLTFPLQILASKTAAMLLPLVGVPVLREGNIINIPAVPLEVAEACSGIRSLFSLVALSLIYGYLTEVRPSIRIMLTLASVPVAVAANSLRIVGVGMLAQYWDPSKAEGFFHVFSGWLIFLVSIGALSALHWFSRALLRTREAPPNGL